jgi:phosphotransferase system enzyme I (PtsI)
VVFAHDLSPADVTQLGPAGVTGFFTEGGGKTSHTAVVARALGLPLVVGVHDYIHHIRTGMTVIVDGGRGEVILDPDEPARARYAARAAARAARSQRLAEAREAPAETLEPCAVHLAATSSSSRRCPAVELGAESIGLFRTEFLYLERGRSADEDEQYHHAVAALRCWAAAWPPSARSTSAATSCRPRCASPAATTRRWACARSATRSGSATSSSAAARAAARRDGRALRILFP